MSLTQRVGDPTLGEMTLSCEPHKLSTKNLRSQTFLFFLHDLFMQWKGRYVGTLVWFGCLKT